MIDPVNARFFKSEVKKLKKDQPDEISGCCPACGDNHYRLHLVHVSEGYDYVKCFNGGCSLETPGTMLNFLYVVNGDVQGYKRATLSSKIDHIKTEANLQDVIDRIKTKPAPKTLEKEIPKLLLNKFEYVKNVPEAVQYLKDRNLEPMEDWLFSKDKFFIYNNKRLFVENYIIIPIYNKNNKFRGWYSRSIKEKKFSTFLLPDTPKFWSLHPSKVPEIITEGIFDALSVVGKTIKNVGASISADIPEEILQTLQKETIIAFDNDKTGIVKSMKYSKLGFRIFVWPDYLNEYKDFNDLLVSGYSKNEIEKIILENLFTSLPAEIRLRMKEI